MGRPYDQEMAALAGTLAWARQTDAELLTEIVATLAARPLLIVGSGGSVSAAHVVARLHEAHARQPARVVTPYEFVLRPPDELSGVLLLTASGSNPDILAAANHAVAADYPAVAAIVARRGSLVAERLATYRYAARYEFDPPAGKDGFLATNSLLATTVLAARAYACAFGIKPSVPEALPPEPVEDAPAMDRPLLIVLAAGWAWPAALDLESKCNESGLGTVICTDYRNFAHGRHHGLARRQDRTAVVAFSTPDCHVFALRTLGALPTDVPILHLTSEGEGAAGAIELLVQVFRLVGRAGKRAGFDPGRPHIPDFGRRLYHMRIPRPAPHSKGWRRQALIDVWIARKVTGPVWSAAGEVERIAWRTAYEAWAARQESAQVAGIVLDYDGTVCEADERFAPRPSIAVGEALIRLLDAGVRVGVATGRGDSVLEVLRRALPDRHWGSVVVGMYNGGHVQSLMEPLPDPCGVACDALAEAAALLVGSPVLGPLITHRFRPNQVTVRQRRPLLAGALRRMVLETLATTPALAERLAVHESGHTVDIIPREVSKLRVVEVVQSSVATGGDSRADVFTIGDQGRLNGNDFAFLSRPHALSVERVSAPLDRCWNIAAPGRRGTTALLDYLGAMRPANDGTVRFAIRTLEDGC